MLKLKSLLAFVILLTSAGASALPTNFHGDWMVIDTVDEFTKNQTCIVSSDPINIEKYETKYLVISVNGKVFKDDGSLGDMLGFYVPSKYGFIPIKKIGIGFNFD